MKLMQTIGKMFGLRASKSAGYHPRDPALATLYGWGMSTQAGEAVSEDVMMGNAAFYACVRNISEDIAAMPLSVFEALEPRGRERLVGHPISRLLGLQPNPDMSAMNFREALIGWALTWGNGYARIYRNGAGEPTEMELLPSNRVTPYRLPQTERLVYQYQRDGEPLTLFPMDVFHLRGLSGDGISGLSVVRVGAESHGLTIATERYGSRFFGNSATPNGVLEHPGKLGDEASKSLKDGWEEAHRQGNQHRVAVLEEGMKWQSIGIPGDDAQLLESRQFSVEEICRWFRMPPHKVEHLLRSTFSNIEHQSIEYVTDTLMPWIVRIEQEANAKLISPSQRGQRFVKHNVDALLRGDTKSRYEAYNLALAMGWINRDEVREKEDLNPMPDGQGEAYLFPLNYAPADQVLSPPEPAPEPEPIVDEEPEDVGETGESDARCEPYLKAAYGKLLDGAFRQVMKVERDRINAGKRRKNFETWCEAYFTTQPEYVRNALADDAERALVGILAMHGLEMTDEVRSLFNDGLAEIAGNHTRETKRRVEAGQEVREDTRAVESVRLVMNLIEDIRCHLQTKTSLNVA